jgi:hypothetical protein
MMTRTLAAERLFGAPTHVVLVNDHGPAVSFTGWRLGTAEATCSEAEGAIKKVTVEVLYSRETPYAVAERCETRQLDGATRMEATVSVCRAAKDVRSVCESPTGDVVRDMARATALDHAIRVWPWLEPRSSPRPSRGPSLSD